MDHEQIAPEHVLFGLLREDVGIAAIVLRGCGFDRFQLRNLVLERCPVPLRLDDRWCMGKLPQTAEFRMVMAAASESARKVGREVMDTGDVLQALAALDGGVPSQIMKERGISAADLTARVADVRSQGHRDAEDSAVTRSRDQ